MRIRTRGKKLGGPQARDCRGKCLGTSSEEPYPPDAPLRFIHLEDIKKERPVLKRKEGQPADRQIRWPNRYPCASSGGPSSFRKQEGSSEDRYKEKGGAKDDLGAFLSSIKPALTVSKAWED